jgi:hypothetical protein
MAGRAHGLLRLAGRAHLRDVDPGGGGLEETTDRSRITVRHPDQGEDSGGFRGPDEVGDARL